MSEESAIKEFPEVQNKLAAPTKKSLFERQKAEAEAKRLREEAETAAVYEDFVKSFEDGDSAPAGSGFRDRSAGAFGPSTLGGLTGPPKRHFAAIQSSGPPNRGGASGPRGASTSSGPGSLGPPPSLSSRKRTHDGLNPPSRDGQGLFAFQDSSTGSGDTRAVFQTSDDEDDKDRDSKNAERAAPKPTLHLSSLPPGTSPAVIKSLLPAHLTIDAVRILPPSGPGSIERKSISAIVTLAKETAANDIDTAVNGVQNKYLGWGYYLILSRHLSSAALSAGIPVPAGTISSVSSLPFGARPVHTGSAQMNRAPPPSQIHRGGFAPPTSYAPTQINRGAPPVQVSVKPPSSLKQLKLIHKTLEALLTHGPEFEALLMSRPDVQKDERWAWIWDPRSPGGVWYRWRLWEILTGAQRSARRGMSQQVFEGGASWMPPAKGLRFEKVTQLEEFVSDSEYDSSEDEQSDDEDRRRYQNHGGPPPPEPSTGLAAIEGKDYLNPLHKAKLAHLLARLPSTNAKLRKGDVARVTAFAIAHAGAGADEVVEMLVQNVSRPFSFTSASPDHHHHRKDPLSIPDAEDGTGTEKEKEDTSPARLIGLYLLSDILSSSSTSGVRHAWRYRQLFEAALRHHGTFESLGRIEKEMGWGRLRAEKWRRSVQAVLALWEGWCVFPQASHEHFVGAFANPPLTQRERDAEAAAAKAERAAAEEKAQGGKSKWKAVEVAAAVERGGEMRPVVLGAPVVEGGDGDVDGAPMEDDDEDVDGVPMVDDDEDMDGVPMDEDADMDGEPMADQAPSARSPPPAARTVLATAQEPAPLRRPPGGSASPPRSLSPTAARAGERAEATTAEQGPLPPRRKPRPKAEDMFADSDEE